ncbi:MAG: prepilin-type N-terminal cleavage/methylation domain-containing protein [Pseudomonadota bacterium]
MRKSKGFTLVEIIVAMALGLVMLTAVYTAINSTQHSASGIESKVVAQQDAKSALELMAMEIRMASYDINSPSAIWVDPVNCTNISANPTYRGIQEATTNSITIEMDISNPPGAVGDAANEIIRYNLANQYITRETRRDSGGCNSSGAQPFLGDAVAGQKTVSVVNAGSNVPLFRYFNAAGTEIYPGTAPAVIPAIRTIEITLLVETEYVDPSSGQKRRLVYSTRVIPRNHGFFR